MKRLFTALLCVVMAFSMVISGAALSGHPAFFDTVSSSTFTVGDANDDGVVDMTDSLDLKKACAGIGEVEENGSDINCDGIVNAKDLLILKKCNAGVDNLENYADDHFVDAFSIAGNDISEYTIVYHENAKYVENTYYAADSLRKYINIATGTNLKIATEQTTEHKIEFVDVTTIPGLEEKLHIENYMYEIVDGDLYIYGTRRGCMYSVFEIVEDYLGYRFYSNDYVCINESRTVDIPEGTYSYREPALIYRFTRQSFGGSGNNEADYHFFPRRLNGSAINGYQEEFRGTLTGPQIANAHSYDYYYRMATGYVDVYYDGTNGGEYGAKYNSGIQVDSMEWNPCSTDDAVYATLFRGLLEGIRYHTSWKIFWEETTSVSFSICDNPNYICSCTSCRYIASTGSSPNGERLGCGGAGLNLYLANRACRDIQVYYEGRPASMEEFGDGEYSEYGYGQPITDYYPGLQLYTILYDHTPPNENILTDERYKDIVPADNLIIMYCGNPCNNHYMGSGECGDTLNILANNGQADAEAFAQWGAVAKASGAEIWFWYYPVNYNTYLTDSPNVFNIWYDFKYIVEECNVTGIFYEGGGAGYLFEYLKAHLGTVMMWSFEKDENGNTVFMSFEEFCEAMKEYLRMFYGDGYEYLYEYIQMQDEAGNVNDVPVLDADGNPVLDENGEPVTDIICYINNCDYPGDMFDYEYIRDNYEYMRGLLTKALALAEGDQIQKVERLIVSCDALGLSACHTSWYEEGTDEAKKALFVERYTWMYNYIKSHNMNVGLGANVQTIQLDLDKTPFELYYGGATWRKSQHHKWTWTGSTPVWGFYG